MGDGKELRFDVGVFYRDIRRIASMMLELELLKAGTSIPKLADLSRSVDQVLTRLPVCSRSLLSRTICSASLAASGCDVPRRPSNIEWMGSSKTGRTSRSRPVQRK